MPVGRGVARVRSLARHGGVVALCGVLSFPGLAETAPVTPILQMRSQAALPASSASELLSMIEQNRQELSELRGLVEQLTFEVQQLKKQSKERYVDLDRRLLELSEGAGVAPRASAGGAPGGVGQGAGGTGTPSGPSSGTPSSSSAASSSGTLSGSSSGLPVVAAGAATVLPSAASASAPIVVPASGDPDSGSAGLVASGEMKQAYDTAYQYIKDREYEKAVDALHAFINQYPESDLTPNAYYWLGEVYLVLPKLEQAKQAFIVVVSKYPGHRKAPDAFFKLGVTYDRLGSPREAETFLKQTVSRFPGTASANLAQEYLKKLK